MTPSGPSNDGDEHDCGRDVAACRHHEGGEDEQDQHQPRSERREKTYSHQGRDDEQQRHLNDEQRAQTWLSRTLLPLLEADTVAFQYSFRGRHPGVLGRYGGNPGAGASGRNHVG
jgi:hypothetical protein